jgi:oligosaccharyltransferase complex subunit gamma
MFKFDAAPNLVVSKPYMAVVSDFERDSYLKEYKWWISHTDGVVTTQKILDFINKRTKKNIIYKPTDETIEYVLKVFLAICMGGVVVYKLLKFIWNHWFFWYLCSIVNNFIPRLLTWSVCQELYTV